MISFERKSAKNEIKLHNKRRWNYKMLMALENGSTDFDEITKFIIRGANCNYERNQITPLIQAVMSNNAEGVRMLVAQGCLINYETSNGRTALLVAAAVNSTTCIEALLSSKQKVNVHKESSKQRTALLEAAKYGRHEAVVILLEMGAEVNSENSDGLTALMEAAMNGHTELLQELIDRGANMRAKDVSGNTALEYAIAGDDRDTINLLVQRLNETRGEREAPIKVHIQSEAPPKHERRMSTMVGFGRRMSQIQELNAEHERIKRVAKQAMVSDSKLCSRCKKRKKKLKAKIRCKDCKSLFCEECCLQFHCGKDNRGHIYEPVVGISAMFDMSEPFNQKDAIDDVKDETEKLRQKMIGAASSKLAVKEQSKKRERELRKQNEIRSQERMMFSRPPELELAELFIAGRRFPEAINMLNEAQSVQMKSLGPKSIHLVHTYSSWVELYLAKGQPQKGLSYTEKCLRLLQLHETSLDQQMGRDVHLLRLEVLFACCMFDLAYRFTSRCRNLLERVQNPNRDFKEALEMWERKTRHGREWRDMCLEDTRGCNRAQQRLRAIHSLPWTALGRLTGAFVDEGTVLQVEGEAVSQFLLIVQGSVKVLSGEREDDPIFHGDSYGMAELSTGFAAKNSLIALERCFLLVLPSQDFIKYVLSRGLQKQDTDLSMKLLYSKMYRKHLLSQAENVGCEDYLQFIWQVEELRAKDKVEPKDLLLTFKKFLEDKKILPLLTNYERANVQQKLASPNRDMFDETAIEVEQYLLQSLIPSALETPVGIKFKKAAALQSAIYWMKDGMALFLASSKMGHVKISMIQAIVRGYLARIHYHKKRFEEGLPDATPPWLAATTSLHALSKKGQQLVAVLRIQKAFRKYRAKMIFLRLCGAVYLKIYDVESDAYLYVNTRTTETRYSPPTLAGSEMIIVPRLACQNCFTCEATDFCRDCGQGFCTPCHNRMHKGMAMRDHTSFQLPLNPEMCIECEVQLAECKCHDCDDIYCNNCYHFLHSNGKRALHKWDVVNHDPTLIAIEEEERKQLEKQKEAEHQEQLRLLELEEQELEQYNQQEELHNDQIDNGYNTGGETEPHNQHYNENLNNNGYEGYEGYNQYDDANYENGHNEGYYDNNNYHYQQQQQQLSYDSSDPYAQYYDGNYFPQEQEQ